MSGLVQFDMAQLATALAALHEKQATNGLGLVDDDWAAVEVWLDSVAANGSNGSTQTVDTYRFHIAKLRWFCENEIGLSPSRWSVQEVNAFQKFLANLPEHAICAMIESAPGKWRNAGRGRAATRRFERRPRPAAALRASRAARCAVMFIRKILRSTGWADRNYLNGPS